MTAVRKTPVLSSQVLGMLIFILTEIMIFASFISAFTIIKSGFTNWPPLGQPRLPVLATAFNSLFLFASAWTILMSHRDKRFFLITLILGLSFVLLQGREWFHLLRYGLTLTSSVYGSFFYLIIGFHALHVLIAVAALSLMYLRFSRGNLKNEAFKAVKIFWFFVVILWPVLYGLVYL